MADRHTDAEVRELTHRAWHATLPGTRQSPVPPDQQRFLTAGGQSLAAGRLIATLRADLGVDIPLAAVLRDNPSLDELVALVARRLADQPLATVAATTPPTASGPAPSREALPPSMRRVWTWHRLNPTSPAYNVVRVLRVDGRLDPTVLRTGLNDLVTRHEALRSAVVEERPGHPELVVGEGRPAPLTVQVLHDPSPAAALQSALYDLAELPLPLHRAPLWRAGLIYSPSTGQSWLALVMHHIISDLRATDIVLNDLATAYAARATGTTPHWPDPAPSLLEHLRHEHAAADSPRREDDLSWWTERLQHVPTTVPLPLAAGTAPSTYAGDCRTLELDTEASNALDQAVRDHGLTPAGLLLTATAVVLAGWRGHTATAVVGLPSVRRSRFEDLGLVGFLLDTLPLPLDVDPEGTFRTEASKIQNFYAEAAEHTLPSFDDIVDRLELPRGGSARSPLVSVWFNDLTQAAPPTKIHGMSVEEHDLPPRWSLFDLGLYVRRNADRYQLHLVTPQGMFEPADMAEFLRQTAESAQRATRDLDQPLYTPHAAAPAMPAVTPSPQRTVALLRHHARSRPTAVALRGARGSLTYGQVWARVEQEAATLRDTTGSGPAVVALPARRDSTFVVRLLACWEANVAPVLVDAEWPESRRASAASTAGVTHAYPWQGEGPATATGAPATSGFGHTLFTSGTTGEPLAVRVDTEVLDQALADLAQWLGVTEHDTISFLSGPAHDPALRDIGLALRAGATLALPPPEVLRNPARTAGWLRQEEVTFVNATPALLDLALSLDGSALPNLRVVVCGGAVLPVATAALIRSAARNADIVNGYGCTETPQLVTAHRVRAGEPLPATGQLPIGAPLPGRQVIVVDEHGGPCEVGRPGQIRILAPYIARDYLGGGNDRFGMSADGRRHLDSGDLARLDARGRLHYAGRRDRQVQVNGYRLDLHEVEAAARSCTGVTDAVAELVGQDGAQTVRVWARRASGADLTEGRLRSHLSATLAASAVPAGIHLVDRLEMTANLKTAAPASPPPAVTPVVTPAGQDPDVDPRLQEVAERVAGRRLRSDENFFEAGLTSIPLLQMVAELSDVLGRQIPPVAAFQHPNLSALSAFLSDAADAPPDRRHRAPGRTERFSQLRADRQRLKT
ncbi:condensation domain-containing protein [Streptomyces mesophilus]|uniref:condensation domain-containing protein n=1 Tax=Streptomyces mesophilus TaxID=1775132 RepID=UPI00331C53D0